MSQVQIIMESLDLFCNGSGQRVSTEKTCVFFSKNVSGESKRDLSSKIGFQFIENLGKYLGVNIFHTRVKRATFSGILDKAG